MKLNFQPTNVEGWNQKKKNKKRQKQQSKSTWANLLNLRPRSWDMITS
jgi:hypothetical protein